MQMPFNTETGTEVRILNSPTGQVLEARPGWSVLVDLNDWT